MSIYVSFLFFFPIRKFTIILMFYLPHIEVPSFNFKHIFKDKNVQNEIFYDIYTPIISKWIFIFIIFITPNNSIEPNRSQTHPKKKGYLGAILLCLLWTIWRDNNNCISERVEHSMLDLKRVFLHSLHDWMAAMSGLSLSSLVQ